ncbi:sugar transferase [Leptolyngbya sp. 'hensonii']|uniref:Npun_R2821/Npun_R2822 family protein n=1 Tax=Leptolyngbya sp. 'hensonii' TaxID=1922337 RepID=UPI00094F86BC|nr:Npun_R2821/Npun_R2822 family protein [Leptolyngbya sp. 'hensonii']OLP17551.1 sugar transferase [Leptolyngbya sp. 'hensonii']
MDGICTLANDRVYDQLIALLNSIEVMMGPNMPVCVFPYDDRVELIKAEIERRPNVQLYDDQDSIQKWDQFVRDIWDAHPTAHQRWKEPYRRMGAHRRLPAFDGPFDRFMYMDADTLLMAPVDVLFEHLNHHDWVVYDFQHKDPTHVYEVSSPKLSELFPPERINSEIFCSGMYVTKRGIFDAEKREWLLSKLREGEAEVLYPMAADQPILNYMVMRSSLSICNLAFQLPPEKITGNSVTSLHFEARNNILYDHGNRLTYLHFIGLPSTVFTQLCAGENVGFLYRDIFLHYRYLKEPENRPKLMGKPKPYDQGPSLATRILKKLNLIQ